MCSQKAEFASGLRKIEKLNIKAVKAAREESYFFLIKGYFGLSVMARVTDRYDLITLENYNFSIFKILVKLLFPFSTLWHTHWGVKFYHSKAGRAFGIHVMPLRSWVRPKHPISCSREHIICQFTPGVHYG